MLNCIDHPNNSSVGRVSIVIQLDGVVGGDTIHSQNICQDCLDSLVKDVKVHAKLSHEHGTCECDAKTGVTCSVIDHG